MRTSGNGPELQSVLTKFIAAIRDSTPFSVALAWRSSVNADFGGWRAALRPLAEGLRPGVPNLTTCLDRSTATATGIEGDTPKSRHARTTRWVAVYPGHPWRSPCR